MGKRKRRTNAVEREDRLSSLPDEILISILSRLPLDLAILSGLLSRRWCNLWTNVNSIYLDTWKFNNNSKFATTINNIMKRITSPVIHTFTLDFGFKEGWSTIRQKSINYWLCKVCNKGVRELKVAHPLYFFTIPSFVFRSQSLVSVELQLVFCSPLPNSIDLPNLKRLFVTGPPTWNWNWFKKLVNGSPLLEELSLKWLHNLISKDYIRLSHGNLKQFSMFCHHTSKCKNIVISAPKLEFMDIRYVHSAIVLFVKEPISLREIKSGTSYIRHCVVSRKKSKLTSKLYTVRRLTFLMQLLSNIENMLRLVRLCPALEVLILQFKDGCSEWNLAKLSDASVLQQVNKIEIEIETYYVTYLKFRNSIQELVEALLSKLMCLEEFHIWMDNKYWKNVDAQEEELMLCKLIYSCPMISKNSEVRFKGKILGMSRKLGPNAWKANDEVISFD